MTVIRASDVSTVFLYKKIRDHPGIDYVVSQIMLIRPILSEIRFILRTYTHSFRITSSDSVNNSVLLE